MQLFDEDFKEALQGSEVREFIKVHDKEKEKDYYIVPFDKRVNGQYLSRAAILIDATTSVVTTTSYVEEPVRYVQLTKKEAVAKVIEDYPEVAYENIEARLVYEDGDTSPSRFYPYWEITAGEKIYRKRQ